MMKLSKIILQFSLLILLLTYFNSAFGQNIVTNPNDGNQVGTLRWAINQTNAGANPLIIFASSLDYVPIKITQGSITITRDVKIIGNGNDKTLITGNSTSRALIIDNHSKVHLRSLSFEDFTHTSNSTNVPGGGVILQISGGLEVSNCNFTRNIATYFGGAIDVQKGDWPSMHKGMKR